MFRSFSFYFNQKVLMASFFGFISGMNLLLSSATLNFWLSTYQINTKIIGLFSIIALPYAFKYFLSFVIDYKKIPFINSHKRWLIFAQLVMVALIFLISQLDPNTDLKLIAVNGVMIAIFAVIIDIVLNGMRIKSLPKKYQPHGTSLYMIGYRMGMCFSGAATIYISSFIDWKTIFLILAFVQIIITLTFFFFLEPREIEIDHIPQSNKNNIYNILIRPFINKITLKQFLWIAIFILFYRVADNILVIMLNPYLIKIGYTSTEIGSVSKLFGSIMVILGGLVSGPLISKFPIKYCLVSFSIIHTIGYSLYLVILNADKNINLLYLLTGYEAFTGGMMMVAYISFISGVCSGKYISSQYALLSSGMGLSRSIFPMISGYIVNNLGWHSFFITTIIISLVSIILIIIIPKDIYDLYHKTDPQY